MEAEGQTWFAELQAEIKKLTTEQPVPDRESLSAAEEWQCRIIGSSLMNWLKKIGPNFLQERAVMAKMLNIDPDPFIVFTTSTPGLVMAKQILGDDDERVKFLLDDQFSNWTSQHPDESYRWHVHVWSEFQEVKDSDLPEEVVHKYPITGSEVYWQHGEGTMWAKSAGRGGDHLWKWNSVELTLLEEAYSHWVA